jgi:CheY-like chemotaxis protein
MAELEGMIDFEFFEFQGAMITAEISKTPGGFRAALADKPEAAAEAPDRAGAIARLKQQLGGTPPVREVAPAPPRAGGVRRLGRPGRVLVVDDNPGALQVAVMICQLCGHGAIAARDGVEAWQHLEAGPVDLVLTDVHMPGMGGLTLVAALKARHPDVPVLAVTAAGPNALKALAGLGVDGVVRKPFGVQELTAAIGALIVP